MQAGDDATLRAVIAIFEEAGSAVVGADEIAPDLVPGAGVLGAAARPRRTSGDAARAAEIVAALGALDMGQGAVVAQGLCLAVEALPGTDAMLDFVAAATAGCAPDPAGAKGVFYKAPKPGQDRRVDLPALGPETVQPRRRRRPCRHRLGGGRRDAARPRGGRWPRRPSARASSSGRGAMKLFLIAGEASGDRLGAALMAGLKALAPEVEFPGVGGPRCRPRGWPASSRWKSFRSWAWPRSCRNTAP